VVCLVSRNYMASLGHLRTFVKVVSPLQLYTYKTPLGNEHDALAGTVDVVVDIGSVTSVVDGGTADAAAVDGAFASATERDTPPVSISAITLGSTKSAAIAALNKIFEIAMTRLENAAFTFRDVFYI
jgi:hypothetical protein